MIVPGEKGEVSLFFTLPHQLHEIDRRFPGVFTLFFLDLFGRFDVFFLEFIDRLASQDQLGLKVTHFPLSFLVPRLSSGKLVGKLMNLTLQTLSLLFKRGNLRAKLLVLGDQG